MNQQARQGAAADGAGRVSAPGELCPGARPGLSARQADRRRRILDACAGLASRGGYEAVQMREVAEEAQVALGTLYRYFPSKTHLLVAMARDQLLRLYGSLGRRPPVAGTPGGRAASTLLRAFAALRRDPLLAEAMIRAVSSADRSARAEVREVTRLTMAIVTESAASTGPVPSAVRVVTHTWFATLTAWLADRTTAEEAATDITTACTLLNPAP